MSWLSKGYKKTKKFFTKVSMYTPFTGFGAFQQGGPLSKAGAYAGVETADSRATERKAAEAKAAAERGAHDAEVAALGASAAEALRNKRRRGLYATVLTGSGPSMGSPGSSSGKSTLGS